ncbi:hypothetical protein AK85_10305 [Streptococcus pneumoniae B1598]|nr:hypothetical protein AK85_10305 [Streptococcus pneumoniae B1598]
MALLSQPNNLSKRPGSLNFIAALPLNFLIVEPIARFILSSFQKPFTGEEVEDFQDDDEIPTII